MGKKGKSNRNKNNKNNKKGVRWPEGLVTVPRSTHGIASATRVTLMYSEALNTAAASGYVTYRANDIFDPQATTSGITNISGNQQPQYSDVWKTLYNKYRVLSSTISVRLVNGSSAIPIFIEVSPEDQLVASSNAVESSVARWASSRIFAYGSSTPSITITRSMSTHQINGVSPDMVLVDDAYQSGTGTTPADPWYWQVRYSAVDFSTVPLVYMFVHITFDVLYTDPVQDVTND